MRQPWNTLVGNALRWFGEARIEVGQARDAAAGKDGKKGHARVRHYRLDEANHSWIAALSMVETAQRFGANLAPLDPGWIGDEWRVAVDPETCWWRRIGRIERDDGFRVERMTSEHTGRSVAGVEAPMRC
jgi:hypothetical protein